MTDWTIDQITTHNFSYVTCMLAGASHPLCPSRATHGADGVERYPKYVMAYNEETTCKNCGAWKDKVKEDLYEVYYDIYGNLRRKDNSAIIEEGWAYTNAKSKEYFVNGFENIDPLQYSGLEYWLKMTGFALCEKCGDNNIIVIPGAACRSCGTVAPPDVINDVPDADVDTNNAEITVSDNENISDNTIVSE